MKKIRHSIFETNSSSTHSLMIMDENTYKQWNENKELCYNSDTSELITITERDKIIKQRIIEYRKKYAPEKLLNKITEEEIKNEFDTYCDPLTSSEYDNDCDDRCLESDCNFYTTKSGEKIAILCKYGHD